MRVRSAMIVLPSRDCSPAPQRAGRNVRIYESVLSVMVLLSELLNNPGIGLPLQRLGVVPTQSRHFKAAACHMNI